MKNQKNNDISKDPANTANWNSGGSNVFTNPAPETDGFIAPPAKKSYTAMYLLGICMLTMLGVFLVGKYQTPAEPADNVKNAESQIDSGLIRIMQLTKDGHKDIQNTEKMVQAFYEYPSNQQVSVDDLNKNPFELKIKENQEAASRTKKANLAEIRAKKIRELERKKAKLKLQSILSGGNKPKCLINGDVFSEGQKVGEAFTVKSIKKDEVVLLAQDCEFILQM